MGRLPFVILSLLVSAAVMSIGAAAYVGFWAMLMGVPLLGSGCQ